jgi:hypothetical protein
MSNEELYQSQATVELSLRKQKMILTALRNCIEPALNEALCRLKLT